MKDLINASQTILTEASPISLKSDQTRTNPSNPELVIPGLGVWTYEALQKSVLDDLNNLINYVGTKSFKQINSLIGRAGSSFESTLQLKVKALEAAQLHMNTPAYKGMITRSLTA